MTVCTDCTALEQPYQPFLTRASYRGNPQAQAAAVAYRTKHYGYFEGFGDRSLNPHRPEHYVESTTFMGLPIKLHKTVIPPLRCVEKAILANCSGPCKPNPAYPGECDIPHKEFPYTPRRLSGLRTYNSFKGGQVSNHVYGIALDIDPSKNSCCGCVGKWKENPLCKSTKYTQAYQRMAMPMCWVEQFEKYGFYWLGHDRLADTMHFAFLGDPAKVIECKSPSRIGNWVLLAGAAFLAYTLLTKKKK